MSLVVIDNYDSFTYNLVHFLGELGARLDVWRNDKISVADVLAMDPDAIVLSPGPCTPNEAGICLELVEKAGARIPMFGVCLGHQSIGQVYGAKVVRAPTLMHGKLSQISHSGTGVFRGINDGFSGNSLPFIDAGTGQYTRRARRHRDRRRCGDGAHAP